MPVFLYGLDSCPTNTTDLCTLEHPVNMAFMKIFNTNSIDIVSYCQSTFGFEAGREQVLRHKINFLGKLSQFQNSLCSCLYVNHVASKLLLLCTQLNVLAQP